MGSYRVPWGANSKSKPTPSRILINKQGLLLSEELGYYCCRNLQDIRIHLPHGTMKTVYIGLNGGCNSQH